MEIQEAITLIESHGFTVPPVNTEGLELWTFASNVRAHAFYEQRGFLLVEQTSGEGNEERSPDRRYAWKQMGATSS